MKTTVAIPLHRSQRWLDVIAGNIERLLGSARIVVSDASGLDDSLDRLQRRFGDLADVEWRAGGAGRSGWVAHCNALLGAATTPYFMWLPHDDEIDEDWVRSAEAELDAHPRSVLAIGTTRAVGTEAPLVMSSDPRFTVETAEDRLRAAIDTVFAGDVTTLGVAFRGVFRRTRAVPLTAPDQDSAWADIRWAGRMLAAGSFVVTTAEYRKRYHDDNEHHRWPPLRGPVDLRRTLVPEIAVGFGDLGASILGELWADELAELRSAHADAMAALAAEHTAAIERLQSDFESSTSWRVTAPLRAARERFGRPDAHHRPSPAG